MVYEFDFLIFSFSQLMKMKEVLEPSLSDYSTDECSGLDALEDDQNDIQPTCYLWIQTPLNQTKIMGIVEAEFEGFHLVVRESDGENASFALHPDFAKDRGVTLDEWCTLIDPDDLEYIEKDLKKIRSK